MNLIEFFWIPSLIEGFPRMPTVRHVRFDTGSKSEGVVVKCSEVKDRPYVVPGMFDRYKKRPAMIPRRSTSHKPVALHSPLHLNRRAQPRRVRRMETIKPRRPHSIAVTHRPSVIPRFNATQRHLLTTARKLRPFKRKNVGGEVTVVEIYAFCDAPVRRLSTRMIKIRLDDRPHSHPPPAVLQSVAPLFLAPLLSVRLFITTVCGALVICQPLVRRRATVSASSTSTKPMTKRLDELIVLETAAAVHITWSMGRKVLIRREDCHLAVAIGVPVLAENWGAHAVKKVYPTSVGYARESRVIASDGGRVYLEYTLPPSVTQDTNHASLQATLVGLFPRNAQNYIPLKTQYYDGATV
ncbi:hypothetical protein BDN70DRAFT_896742 [Pholiota conissans]|uniref:Uncharacterized protein n=1 Tax=Pholiota conissans TaxID=109636 RepID=A0A9P5YX88_9AGAR|nr:hypothetical protein BDN70DRAFT_896742 [Pholiota conissans]